MSIKEIALQSDAEFDRARRSFGQVVEGYGLKSGIELGVECGGNVELLMKEYGVEEMVGVDPYVENTRSARELSQKDFDLMYEFVRERVSGLNYSHIRSLSRTAVKMIDKQYDFIFIDADHNYSSVKEDISLWYPLIKYGGVIGGHDYGHPSLKGVKRAVDELFGRFGARVNTGLDGVWWIEKQSDFKRIDYKKISVAIPTYNSSRFIKDALDSLQDPRISDIVVTDDNSDDYEELKAVVDSCPKARLYRNKERLGGFWNKHEAIKRCLNRWVILLDSDNTITDKYLEAIYSYPGWVNDVIYCPDYGTGKIDYRNLDNLYIGVDTAKDVNPMLLDTGNFLLNRDYALNSVFTHDEVRGHVPCSIFINYYWMLSGGKLFVVPGMEYYHRIRKDSYWFESNSTISKYDKEIHNCINNDVLYVFKEIK